MTLDEMVKMKNGSYKEFPATDRHSRKEEILRVPGGWLYLIRQLNYLALLYF